MTTDVRYLLKAVIEALPDPVIALGADRRILATNHFCHSAFPSLRDGDLLAIHLRAPEVLECVEFVASHRIPRQTQWLERVPLARLFEVYVSPIHNPEWGNCLLMSIRDLTETRQIERMRVDFIANASHELRTPLASLLGFVETLQGAARHDDRARERFLNIMHDQAQRMSRLVDDLLSLSRIEQNAHVQPATMIDLVMVVHHVVDALKRIATVNKAQLNLEVPHSLMVLGDRDELIRVCENLFENAIKYGHTDEQETSQIDILVTQDENYAILKVRDYGPGIAYEHLPRLTERFYRIDAGKSRAKGGTGLGLAIVKHIMMRHRGRLKIDSEFGEGSEFTILLPKEKNK